MPLDLFGFFISSLVTIFLVTLSDDPLLKITWKNDLFISLDVELHSSFFSLDNDFFLSSTIFIFPLSFYFCFALMRLTMIYSTESTNYSRNFSFLKPAFDFESIVILFSQAIYAYSNFMFLTLNFYFLAIKLLTPKIFFFVKVSI